MDSVVGGHCGRETPGPIPNPVAKPSSADGTALARVWESRSSPTFNFMGCAPDCRVRGISHFRIVFGPMRDAGPAGHECVCFWSLARVPRGRWSGPWSSLVGVASGPVVPVGSAHLARLPVTSHPLQGLRGRRNVCDVGRPVRRTKKLGRRSAVSGPFHRGSPSAGESGHGGDEGSVPAALTRGACEVDEGCGRWRTVARRALCASRGPSGAAGHVRRVRCPARGVRTVPPPRRRPWLP